MTRLIANNFTTTLDGAITDSATSITLTSVTGFPAVGSGDTCQVTLDDGAGNIEVVTATAIAGSVITITRAQEGTSGFAFADLDTAAVRDTALLYTDVLASDETPTLIGPIDASASGVYVGFGGSSTTTAYCLTHAGNVPSLRGATNYQYTFDSTTLKMEAGTSWYSLQMNNSGGFTCTTNNTVRIQANNSGVQFGATGARITSIADEDDMSSDSATLLCTQQSIKAYVDASGGGGGLTDVVGDTTPQLGGDLDLNGNNIDFPTTANISDCLDEDTMVSDSATKLCTQQSIKAYVDASDASTEAFSVYLGSTQSVVTATMTKINFGTEDYDTGTSYDNATNYRFLPTTAGYYRISASMATNVAVSDGTVIELYIKKNGTTNLAANYGSAGGTTYLASSTTCNVNLNGSTDYIEVFVYHNLGSNLVFINDRTSSMHGELIHTT